MKESSVIENLSDRGETAIAVPPVSVTEAAPATLEEAMGRLEVEVSRRIHAEQALNEADERFRQLSEHTGKFLWISDPKTNELTYVSPGFEDVWSRSREGSYASPQEWVNSFKRIARNVTPVSGQPNKIYQVASPDGSVRWIRDRMFPLRDATGRVQRVLGVAEDVTEARALHETATQSAARAKALYTIIPDFVFRIRKDGTVLESHLGDNNPLSGLETQIAGKHLKYLLPANLTTFALEHLGEAMKSRRLVTFTCEYLWPEELRDFETRLIACGNDEAMALVRDITEHKRLEREIVEAAHREQQRIGQDLHDSLGQHLTAITFLTKVLERKLAAKAVEEAEEAAEIGRLVVQALAQTRNLARGLLPAELEQGGLGTALRELIGTIQKTSNVRCELEIEDSLAVKDHILATHVFRITQEAMNNAVKHGKAQCVHVTLKSNGDQVELSVSDNGTGFPSEPRGDGLGLRIMNYRARRIGGSLEVSENPQGGARVTCLFHNKYESN